MTETLSLDAEQLAAAVQDYVHELAAERIVNVLDELRTRDEVRRFMSATPVQNITSALSRKLCAEIGEHARRRCDSFGEPNEPQDDLRTRIDAAKTINAVTDLMLDPATQKQLSALPGTVRDDVREYAKSRLVALGWPVRPKKAAGGIAR